MSSISKVNVNGTTYDIAGSGSQGIYDGYLYNGAFYSDSAHTTLITGKANALYVNLGSGNNDVYRYDGSSYLRTSKDYLTKVLADTYYADKTHTHSYADITDVDLLNQTEINAILNT